MKLEEALERTRELMLRQAQSDGYADGVRDGIAEALLGDYERLWGSRVRVTVEWLDPAPPEDFLARRLEQARVRRETIRRVT